MVTYYLKERSSIPPQSTPDERLIESEMEKSIDEIRNATIISYEENFDFEMNRAIKSMHELSNICRKLEEKEMGVSLAFERAMADMIIMLFPFAPMFAAEMWQGFASAPWHYPELSAKYDWNKDVWEQKWPRVDDDCLMSIFVALNGENLSRILVPKRDFDVISAKNIESILLKYLVNDDRFTAKCGGNVGVFEGLTFANPRRYSAEVNIIMNSIPTNDSAENPESSDDQLRQSKKKARSKIFDIPIRLT